MALFIGYGLGFLGIYIVFLLSWGQSRKKKRQNFNYPSRRFLHTYHPIQAYNESK